MNFSFILLCVSFLASVNGEESKLQLESESELQSELPSELPFESPFESALQQLPVARKTPKVPKTTKAPTETKAPNSVKAPKAGKASKAPKAPKATKAAKASKVAKATKAAKASKVAKATKTAKATKVPKITKAAKATKVPKITKVAKSAKNAAPLVEVRVSMQITGTCDCDLATPIYQNSLSSSSSIPSERISIICTPYCFRRRLSQSIAAGTSRLELVGIYQGNPNNPSEAENLNSFQQTASGSGGAELQANIETQFSDQNILVVTTPPVVEQRPAPTGPPVQTLAPTPSPTTGPTVNNTSLRFLTIAEVPLRYVGDCEAGECGKCMGDCKDDIDCADGLRCFNRGAQEIVPGCTGGGIHDVEGKYTAHTNISIRILMVIFIQISKTTLFFSNPHF